MRSDSQEVFLEKAQKNHADAYRHRREAQQQLTEIEATLQVRLDRIAANHDVVARQGADAAAWMEEVQRRTALAYDGLLQETPQQQTYFQTGYSDLRTRYPTAAYAIEAVHDDFGGVQLDGPTRVERRQILVGAQRVYDHAVWYLYTAREHPDEALHWNLSLGVVGEPLPDPAPAPAGAGQMPGIPPADGDTDDNGEGFIYPFQDPDRDRCLRFRVGHGHQDELCQVPLGEDGICQYHG